MLATVNMRQMTVPLLPVLTLCRQAQGKIFLSTFRHVMRLRVHSIRVDASWHAISRDVHNSLNENRGANYTVVLDHPTVATDCTIVTGPGRVCYCEQCEEGIVVAARDPTQTSDSFQQPKTLKLGPSPGPSHLHVASHPTRRPDLRTGSCLHTIDHADLRRSIEDWRILNGNFPSPS